MKKEQKITFKQFMDVFNFRAFSQDDGRDNYDTKIVRFFLGYDEVYDENALWFEFGVYDFAFSNWDLLQKIFNKDICESYVDGMTYNSGTGMTEVWLNIERKCASE